MPMASDVTIELKGVERLRPGDESYPARVLEVPGRPRILRVLGDLNVLSSGPVLAVVGVREVTPEIARRAATLKIERPELSLPAALVFASAQEHGAILVTRNHQEFPANIPGIRIPYT